MVQKPRLKHADLAESDLTPKERQAERTRRWLINEKLDPDRALELKARNTENKRDWRRRQKELQEQEKEKNKENAPASTEGKPPRKRRRVSRTEASSNISGPSNPVHDPIPIAEMPSGLAGPSNSTHQHIPIDPVLLNQETPLVTGTPSLMCDVAVMTDIPDTPIHSPPHVQTPISRDLATPIIGSQVDEQSETVQWCDGSTTVLPCLMRGGINILQEDADAVSCFASLPESLPETSQNAIHLRYSDWCSNIRGLCDEICAALRIGKAVVIRQVTTPEPATLDLDYLEDRGM